MDNLTDDILTRLLNIAIQDPIARLGLGVAIGLYIIRKLDGGIDASTEIDSVDEALQDIALDIAAIVDKLKNDGENNDK